MKKNPIVITSIARTPQGNLLGVLKDMTAPQLGSAVIKAVLERSSLSADKITDVMLGCVLSAGLGQAPARQAALGAGLSIHTTCTTINKMCASGMKAVMLAENHLVADDMSEKIMIAGGMESMTNAPYLIPKARQGYRAGHAELIDHMMWDGLEDVYEKNRPMGYFAEQCATQYGFTREEQDHYAMCSLERAQKAIREKNFSFEIIPVSVTTREGNHIIDTDERPLKVNKEKIPFLPSVFVKNGTVTAGNSSSISDGAAAMMLMRESQAEKEGVTPLARIIGQSEYAKSPGEFTTAPIDAIRILLKKINWSVDHVDLFEINEAFAVVVLAAMRDLKIPHDKINIYGGGCALGHPIGATGARIIVTLISALKKNNLKRGVAALCIGGGEAAAIAIEII